MEEKLPYCLNCQQKLSDLDNFCPTCGQKNHATQLTIWSFLKELLQSTFSVDARIWVTLKMAFFRIGQLAQEFNLGKRRKYIRPIQFYLFCSIIYFLLMGIVIRKYQPDAKSMNEVIEKQDTVHWKIIGTDFTLSQTEMKIIPTLSNQQLDSLLEAKNIKSNFFIYNFLLGQSLKIIDKGLKNISQQLFSIVSFGMFALMPFLAWLLYLFFFRQYSFYVEHLVFSIYMHAIIFLILSAKLIANFLGFMGWSNSIFYFGVFLYGVIGIKQFYKFNWVRSTFYSLGLFLIHGTILLVFMILAFLISITLA